MSSLGQASTEARRSNASNTEILHFGGTPLYIRSPSPHTDSIEGFNGEGSIGGDLQLQMELFEVLSKDRIESVGGFEGSDIRYILPDSYNRFSPTLLATILRLMFV